MQTPKYEIVKRGYLYQVTVDGQDYKLPTRDLTRAEGRIDTLKRQAKVKIRKCMTCRASFVSEGIHNRMCSPCRLHAQEPVAV